MMKNTAPTVATEVEPAAVPAPRSFGRPRSLEGEKEIPVGPVPVRTTDAASALPSVTPVEMPAGPKAVFVMGPGRSGKTTLLRFIMESCCLKGLRRWPPP